LLQRLLLVHLLLLLLLLLVLLHLLQTTTALPFHLLGLLPGHLKGSSGCGRHPTSACGTLAARAATLVVDTTLLVSLRELQLRELQLLQQLPLLLDVGGVLLLVIGFVLGVGVAMSLWYFAITSGVHCGCCPAAPAPAPPCCTACCCCCCCCAACCCWGGASVLLL